MNRATHVCLVCKTRKKACDKALPRCGSCSRRGLPCSYIELQKDEKPSLNVDHTELLVGGGFLSSKWHISDDNFDAIPYFQLCKILRQTHLSVPRVGEHYFRDFHRTLPIICPTLFRDTVSKYKGTSPPADFSILLLALCLLAWNPSGNSSIQQDPTLLKNIYVTVQVLFARVQVPLCTSTSLIQASLVIAAFEYASGQPRAAHITLGTCARMISSIGLNIHKIKDLNISPQDRRMKLRAREDINLWWGAATFERIVLCDIPDCKQAPILQFPDNNTPLPPDLRPAQDHSESIHFPSRPTLSELDAKNINGFGRQIQVTYLLDHLLWVIIHPMTNKQHHIAVLQSLDQEIRIIMAVLIRDCDHEWRHYCGAIGTATRSLFLLHEHIQMLHVTSSDIRWLHQCSLAGLGFVTQVMVDVAHDHLQRITPTNAGALPLSCAYNLQAAIKHIKFEQIQKAADGCKAHNANLESLLALDNICYQRWRKSS